MKAGFILGGYFGFASTSPFYSPDGGGGGGGGLIQYEEIKNFDSVNELTANGWENLNVYNGGFLTVSNGRLVVPDITNDTSGALRYVFPSGVTDWKFSIELTIAPSSWGGHQYFQAFGGSLVDIDQPNWDKNPGFWSNTNTTFPYTGPTFYGNGNGGEAYVINSGYGVNGTWVFHLEYSNGHYKVWRETLEGVYVDGAEYDAPSAGGIQVGLRYGNYGENYCSANWLKLSYTAVPPPPPEPEVFTIKNFDIDDRYDDGWQAYGNSATNGTVSGGYWISDSSYMFQHGLLKYATLGVGSFLEVKFQFSETAIGLNFEIGFHSSINTSRIFTYMQPDTFDFNVCDSMGNGVANETTTPVFEPYIFKIEALESLVPGKILARYSMNGTTKFEEYVDQSAFDCIYIVMNSAYSDPISVDYVKYRIV